MAVRSLKYSSPLLLYDRAKHEAKNILGLHFGQNRSGICVWNLAEGTIKPLLNNVEGASQRYVILDHARYSIDEISKQLDAIAVDQNAVGYVAGFPDHPDYRRDPMTGSHVKKHLLGLLNASKNQAGTRYFSLFSDSYSTVIHDIMRRLSKGGNASIDEQHAEVKTMAAIIITRRLQSLAEGGEASRACNYRNYEVYQESQKFMISICDELGCSDDMFSSHLSRIKKD